MGWIKEEFARRVKKNEIEPTLAAQARLLHKWFRNQYPSKIAPEPKTIEDSIRTEYNDAKRKAPKQ